ncbi:DUF4391 domain-containing protein [Runella limosa]|uniref:DUF4391 domain-containing protein n=1 Tax=Runella limosa TaxID=370978 RepID=UPI00041BF74C|nr:DUF4391 domain-containing protein [Runella limosa]
MSYFKLPETTKVERIIPKNSFDAYINAKQKKKFVDLIERIRWANKLSFETINLSGEEIQEIQVFTLELRARDGFDEILDIINKAIPYPIIFFVEYKEQFLISACRKHPHPLNEDNTIIDWVFKSDWIAFNNSPFELRLKKNLDFVYFDLCRQLARKSEKIKSLAELCEHEQKIKQLTSAIHKLETTISKSKQFNRKVELNLELQSMKKALGLLVENG